MKPIYVGNRIFLGLKDLVVSLYTERCQFKCSYCNLPEKSHPFSLSTDIIKDQIDEILDKNEKELPYFQQFSIGNEGSILDPNRFPKEALDHLLEQTSRLPALEVLSLETRPEYIKAPLIEKIQQKTGIPKIDVTIGFETQDDHLREVVLNKTISKKLLEKKIKLLGEMNIRLTCYVLLKPGPTMTELDGIDEAIKTIEYLYEQCQKSNVELLIYLNPVYAAKGTPLAEQFIVHNYQPPKIQSAIKIIKATRELNIPIYTGLWSEGNAEDDGDYHSLQTHQDEIRKAIKLYNKTQSYSVIEPHVNELRMA